MTTRLQDKEIKQFTEDEIVLWGYKKPVIDKKNHTVLIYKVWFESRPYMEGWLVILKTNTGQDDFTYHDFESKTPLRAFSKTKEAQNARDVNKNFHFAFTESAADWVSKNDVDFTKIMSQNAGFCMLGVSKFYAEYGWGDIVSSKQVLDHYCAESQSFCDDRIGMVVHQAYRTSDQFVIDH